MNEGLESLSTRSVIVALSFALVFATGCVTRIGLHVDPNELGSVWIDPAVAVPSQIEYGNMSTRFGPLLELLLIPLRGAASERQRELVDEAASGEGVDLGEIVHQAFVEGVRQRQLFALAGDPEGSQRIELQVNKVDIHQMDFGWPRLSLEMTAKLLDDNGEVLWQQTEWSEPYRSDEISIADYALGTGVFGAVLRCAATQATSRLLSSITYEEVAATVTCEGGVEAARKARRVEESDWERQTATLVYQPVWRSMSCESPFDLAQDCSILNLATRKIRLGSAAAVIAGTSDGRVVFVQAPGFLGNLATKSSERFCRKAVLAIRKRLADAGIQLVSIRTKPTFGDNILGIVLELDGDGYAILREHSIE